MQAQAIVSEAIDRQPVDSALLEAAKAHCRTCDQCGRFVRALNIVQRAPLPAPPDDLTDRIMALVRAQAAADEQAAAAVTEEAATADALEAALAQDADDATHVPAPATSEPLTALEAASEAARARIAEESAARVTLTGGPRPKRAEAIAWIAGVAAVLVLVVVGGALGILNSMNARQSASEDAALTYNVAPELGGTAPSQPETMARTDADTFAASKLATSTVNFVTYGAYVYRQAGSSKPSQVGLTGAGTVDMSFSADTAFEMHDVYTAQDEPDIIYIENAGSYERFELVTRSFEGKTYVLTSGVITSFGAWPTLPSGIPTPSSADGAPVFVEAGTDALGVAVFRRTDATTSTGIAVAPGTAPADPAAGNPNWTWWVPKP